MESMKWIRRSSRSLWGVSISLLLLATVTTGVFTRVCNHVLSPIQAYNDTYLESSIIDAAQFMVPIGVAKGAADIIEGSTLEFGAGVVVANASTTLEIGDALQPLLDYLDIAWRILIVSIIFSTVSKVVLLGSAPVTQIMLVVSFFSFAVAFLLRLILKAESPFVFVATRMAKMTLLVALVFLLVLPFTIYLAAHLSVATTSQMQSNLFQSFTSAGNHFKLDGFYAAEGIKEKASYLYDKSLELMKYALVATKDIAISVAKLFVIKLLNGVVFPLGALAFLIWLMRGILYPVLGLSGTNMSTEDARNIAFWLDSRRQSREALNDKPA